MLHAPPVHGNRPDHGPRAVNAACQCSPPLFRPSRSGSVPFARAEQRAADALSHAQRPIAAQETPMKTTRTLLATALIALPFALATTAIAGSEDLSSTEKVKVMDMDGDNRLSLAEFTAGGRKTAEDFARFDVNGDGYVTDEEIDVGKERGMTPGEKKDARAKAHPVPTTDPKSPEQPPPAP
jgi:hypothetical protein